MKKDSNKYFNLVILIGILLIPFMYSFFYLKAYWNPYGEGNIDNLPVAIVNLDEGDKGDKLIKSIKEKKKLKLSVTSEKKAEDGLYNKDYYAVITIPKDFTSDMESAGNKIKRHATITYSPNQKSNYLASQIINNVVTAVEKNLDNEVNSEIIGGLTETVEDIPTGLNKVSDGFTKLQDGTEQVNNGTWALKNGSETLKNGTSSVAIGAEKLRENYNLFNNGVKNIQEGTEQLNAATREFSALSGSLNQLAAGVGELNSGSNNLNVGVQNYVAGTNQVLTTIEQLTLAYCSDATTQDVMLCANLKGLVASDGVNTLKNSGNILTTGTATLSVGLNELNTKVSGLASVNTKLTELQIGISKLNDGANTLYGSSLKIQDGINKLQNGAVELNSGAISLSNGASTLYQGTTTLNNSVKTAKTELDQNISETKEEIKKVETLKEYSKSPVKIKTKPVNEVSSYGTAFSPFFISIALWVGCLMMYIVLYYDKDQRFKIFGMNNKNKVQRTLCYHLLATLSAITLGISLNLLLDFEITNLFLYFISIILVANAFMGIIEFLIINFNDVGKFLSLILLVLQLAAAGGTFPIETVTKGFRGMHSFLPMTYTINLLRESLVSIESSLLTKNIIIVILMFLIFFVFNIVMDIIRQNKNQVK